MASKNSSGFQSLEQVLAKAAVLVGAAESHGMLCGLSCSGNNPGYEVWVDWVLADAQSGPSELEECQAILARVYEDTLAELYSVDMNFQPLLPDDESTLDTRTMALGKWCEGFLFGLGIGRGSDASELPKNLHEIFRDLGEISKIQFEIEGPVEEAEQDFVEVVEYVRTAVLLVGDELRPAHSPAQLQ